MELIDKEEIIQSVAYVVNVEFYGYETWSVGTTQLVNVRDKIQ